ncbi:two-partner secretion domain-containing protein [Gloeomargarita lithophora]|uniref:two-partner secretion domain-containing protein n=1 Tax=Gloeomargarita lithophora TaxID=1188228 RepID=UPI0012FDE41C
MVTQGQATIQQESATKLNINQSTDRAVINWNGFSIGAPEWVNFQQPSSTSATLNRVTGNTPSSIAGKLTANGQIFLINPNGIMFLPTARVDVAGLVASTLNIQDSDFMRGVLRFEQMPGKAPASVVNQGLITVKEAGFAALVAPAVQNSGVISARLGKVVLASGTTVSLDFYGDGLLSVTVDPNLAGQITDIYGNKLNSLIDNQGNITAPGGIVTLTAQAAGQIVDSVINTSGIIEAKYAENRNGVIVLSGGSQGIVAVNGELNVSGERGGKVEITGEKIALNGNALIDASGNKGGGIVNIGGSFQGKGTLPNAQMTYVGQGAEINASAVNTGNGGEVIVWADKATGFYGEINAKGGEISGDGGFVEVSGRDYLDFQGTVNTLAVNGKTGTLLLDPQDLTISTAANSGVPNAPNVFFADNGSGNSILNDTTLANATTNVVLQATRDITFSSAVLMANNNIGIKAQAGRNIAVNANITTRGGDIELLAGTFSGAAIPDASGSIVINGNLSTVGGSITGGSVIAKGFNVNPNRTITTNTGNVTIEATNNITATPTANTIVGVGTGNVSFIAGQNIILNPSGFSNYRIEGSLNLVELKATNGTIQLGGTGTGGAFTRINATTVNFEAGQDIVLQSNIDNTFVSVTAGTGGMTVKAGQDIKLLGGSGTNAQSRNVTITSNGLQTITANRDIILTSGSGTNANVTINSTGTSQSITAGKNITLSSGNPGMTFSIISADNNTTVSAGDRFKFTDSKISSINGTVTLRANENIIGTNSNITTQGKDIVLNSDRDSTNGGAIELTNTTITSNNGNIILGGGIDPLNNPAIGTSTLTSGVELNGATLAAGAGNITLTGKGFNTGANNYGIFQNLGAEVITESGNITYTGTGGNGTNNNYGVFLTSANTTITSDSGAISITGKGGNGTESKNYGIYQFSGAKVSTKSGNITYKGTGGDGESNNYGVFLEGTNTLISTTGTGTVNLTGQGGNGMGKDNYGIYQFSGAQVSTESGSITYKGTGGNGITRNHGIFLQDGTTATTTISTQGTGAISLTGTGQGTSGGNFGIFLDNPVKVSSVDGQITYTGKGADGNNSNVGILQGDGAQVTSVNGDISYTGTGGNGISGNSGIGITGNTTKISTTGTGKVDLTGIGQGTGTNNTGIGQANGAQVSTTTGNITYTGTGSNGADAIRIASGGNIIGNKTTGAIKLTSTNNAIILNDVTVNTTEDIIINSPGSVTQNNTGGLFADGLELLGTGAYTLNNISNDIATLATNTTNNIKYTDVGGFEIGIVNKTNGINTTGNVTLTAGDTVTQSHEIIANGLALLGSGKFELENSGNTITTIAADTTNDISFVNSKTLTVGTVNPDGIEDANSVFLQALTGDIVVNKSITATNDITLVADDNFINNVGATALTSGGTFLVYATSPQGNVNGFPVLGGSEQFKTTFPQPALFIGKGFLYKVGAELIPGLPSSSFTEPVTFTLNFNDREWRDLSDMGEAVLFPEALLCLNVPVNQNSASTPLTDPLVLRTENLPSTNIQWQTGDFPTCKTNQASR